MEKTGGKQILQISDIVKISSEIEYYKRKGVSLKDLIELRKEREKIHKDMQGYCGY